MERGQFISLITLNFTLRSFWGGLFYEFSTSQDYYESPDCESLRYYCYYFAQVTITMAIIDVITLLLASCNPGIDQELRKHYSGYNFIYALISFILFILMFVAMFKNEPCGDLRVLVMTLFIITLVILFGCCVCCCVAMSDK